MDHLIVARLKFRFIMSELTRSGLILIEYFITTEEYEKCAKIKDLMSFRNMIDNILNTKNAK